MDKDPALLTVWWGTETVNRPLQCSVIGSVLKVQCAGAGRKSYLVKVCWVMEGFLENMMVKEET